jgi:osmoprotectant transport system ATP-binding protein
MIEFKNIRKSFKNNEIIKGIDLKVNEGELSVLIGPSGCGKTSSLKMINKLINPTSGNIYIKGNDIAKQDTIELRRNIGYVIQQTGLFPHMTVGQNIGLVPNLKKWDENKVIHRTKELLQLVGLKPDEYMNRYPGELSGGQQQRVGVARAFATDPDIILMDEPFSALDPITRNQLQDELFTLQQEMKKTIVFVTHDMDEALRLGDRICIMKDGVILQYDTPEVILKNPAHQFIDEFIGKNRIWNQPEFIKAKDIMIEHPIKTTAGRSILQAIEIMKTSKVDSLLITNKDSELEGIVTLKKLRKELDINQKLFTIMEKNVITVDVDDSIIDVLNCMNEHNVGYIPVTSNSKKLVGLITRSSLLSVMSSQFIDQEVKA